MNPKWEINGQILELDLDNADVMERYEKAFDLMGEEENNIPRDGRFSDQIRAYCKLFRDLFDRIFGEGASEKIFSGIPLSISAYDEVYISFLNYVKGQITASLKAQTDRLAKYAPKVNKKR